MWPNEKKAFFNILGSLDLFIDYFLLLFFVWTAENSHHGGCEPWCLQWRIDVQDQLWYPHRNCDFQPWNQVCNG